MLSIRLSYCTQGDYMLIGYARISTLEQNHDLQLDTLTQAGCQTIYTETMSGAKRHRPELEATLKSLRLLICT
ncbi:MAG: recombinase family protein [Kangiellaceae bacterium]|nr:recombinase family protein [Kangiellaceae bacterium]